MFRNYLKTAFRNLLRYKGFAFINITGLTIGIIGCMVIGLFVWDEWKFDKNIPGFKVLEFFRSQVSIMKTSALSV
jgi:putative ABC transport system permease protein